jgi:hypothetical protein
MQEIAKEFKVLTFVSIRESNSLVEKGSLTEGEMHNSQERQIAHQYVHL